MDLLDIPQHGKLGYSKQEYVVRPLYDSHLAPKILINEWSTIVHYDFSSIRKHHSVLVVHILASGPIQKIRPSLVFEPFLQAKAVMSSTAPKR